MSHRIFVASLLAIAGLVVPSTASAAVERDGEALFPKNGAELLEAVELSADGPDRGVQARIVLEAKTYVIDRTIDLHDHDGDVIRGPEAGGAVITGTAQSGTLLRLQGETNRVEHVTFRAPATTRSYALVELDGRALLDSAVDVPASAPNVTGVLASGPRLYGWSNTILAPVASAAVSASAVRATGSFRIDAPIQGGSTTVDIDQAGANGLDEEIWIRADLTGGPQTFTVLRARSGVALDLILHKATLTATRSGATVVDLQGASAAAGRLRTWLLTSTLVGPPDGTGLQVGPGVGSEPSKVDAVGLLSIGSARAIVCSPGSGPASVIDVDAIYREGDLAPSPSCTLSEQRRVTGDPKFVDREGGDLTPRWGSVLIDAAPVTRWGVFPLTTSLKPQVLPNHGADTPLPNDIGAAEYQYTVPVFGTESFAALDNRGLVRVSISATDPDPAEQHALSYLWSLPDGSHVSGPTATYRYEKEPDSWPARISVTVTDESGIMRVASVGGTPILEPGKPYRRFDVEPTPAPVPDWTPAPQPGLVVGSGDGSPRAPLRPPFGVSAPPAPPPLVVAPTITSFGLASSRMKRAKRPRETGLGSARRGEVTATLTLVRASEVLLSVHRSGQAKELGAIRVRGVAGANAVRLTPRFGRRTLAPGLYDVMATTKSAVAGTQSLRVRVRVLR